MNIDKSKDLKKKSSKNIDIEEDLKNETHLSPQKLKEEMAGKKTVSFADEMMQKAGKKKGLDQIYEEV